MFSNSQNQSAASKHNTYSEQKSEQKPELNFELKTKVLSVDKKCSVADPQEALYLTVKDETTPKIGVLHTMFGVDSTEEFKRMVLEVYKLAEKFDSPDLGECDSFIALDDRTKERRTEECAVFIFKAAVAGKLDLDQRFKKLLVNFAENLSWVRLKEVETFKTKKTKLSFNNSTLTSPRYINLWASLILHHISLKRQGLDLDITNALLRDLFRATQNSQIKSKRKQFSILLKSKLHLVFSTRKEVETKPFVIVWPPTEVASEQEQNAGGFLAEATEEHSLRSYKEEDDLSIEHEELEDQETERKAFVADESIALPCDKEGYLLTDEEQAILESNYNLVNPSDLQAKTFIINRAEDSLEIFRVLEEEINRKIGFLPFDVQEEFIRSKQIVTEEFDSLLALSENVCPEKATSLHACCKSLEQLLQQINDFVPVRDLVLEEDLMHQESVLKEEKEEIENNLQRINRLKQELEASRVTIQNAQKEIDDLQNLDERNSLENTLLSLATQKKGLEAELVSLTEQKLNLDEALLTVQKQKQSLYSTNKELKTELAELTEQQAQQVYNENALKERLINLEQENQRLKATLSSLQENTQTKGLFSLATNNSGSSITVDESSITAFRGVSARAPLPLPNPIAPANRLDAYNQAVLNFVPLGERGGLDEEAHLYNSANENESTTTLASSVSTVRDRMERRSVQRERGAEYATPFKHSSSQIQPPKPSPRASKRTIKRQEQNRGSRDSISSADEDSLSGAVGSFEEHRAPTRERQETSSVTTREPYARNETPTHNVEWIARYFQTGPHSMSAVKFLQTKWKISRLKAKVKKYRKKNKLDKLEKANRELMAITKYLDVEQSLMKEKEKAMNSFVEQKKHMYLAEKKQFKELNMHMVKKQSQLSGSYFDLQNELLKEQAYELQRQQLQEQRQKSLSTFNLAERELQTTRPTMSRATSVKSLLERQAQQARSSSSSQKDQQTYTIAEETTLEQQYTQTIQTPHEGIYEENDIDLQQEGNIIFISPTDVVNSMPVSTFSNSVGISRLNSPCDKREASLLF